MTKVEQVAAEIAYEKDNRFFARRPSL